MSIRLINPSGEENIAPTLRSRSKSVTDLMSNAIKAGPRPPAKRNALGDVTNRGLVPRESNGQQLKIDALLNPHNVPPLAENKAPTVSISSQDLYRQSDRRVPAWERDKRFDSRGLDILASIASTDFSVPSSRPDVYHLGEPESTRPFPFTSETLGPGQLVRDSAIFVEERFTDRFDANTEPWLPPPSAACPSLAGRHFKSQPQLKVEQPTLRRTQSKQFERTPGNISHATVMQGAPAAMIATSHAAAHGGHSALTCLPANQERLTNDDESCDFDFCQDCDLNLDADDSRAVQIYSEGNESRDEPVEYEVMELYTTTYGLPPKTLLGPRHPVIAPSHYSACDLEEINAAKLVIGGTVAYQDLLDDMSDPYMVAGYSEEIFSYMHELEARMLPYTHYMDGQEDLDWHMRSILIGWIVEVHDRFHLLPETLYLAVNYIDRFLCGKIVSTAKLQLVGATALLVATKYEEISCPEIREIAAVVDNCYSNNEIMKAERYMLTMLRFELGWPGPMNFLRRISKADCYDVETRTMAKYFLELALVDSRFVSTLPSYLAAATHCLAMLILEKGYWKFLHVYYSGFTYRQLLPAIQTLLHCCERPLLHHESVFKKYSTERFQSTSRVVQRSLSRGFSLPDHRYVGRPVAYHE
ncbi:hypothetical protein CDD81_5833 [Ophiocordyceps australis]|uniref:Uncharacterized protein n=1 Tax=Ophiocordyceps australis TaxID=1399860 RepID=A0A2C5Y917_9HYPO|nr:hypothetical protein CDD81_5833 [Ophiocordyceps australis]